MFKQEAVFGVDNCITPDLAAKLANLAAQYDAVVYLESNGVRLRVDSLISILSMDVRRGGSVLIVAEGKDAENAAAAVSALLSRKG